MSQITSAVFHVIISHIFTCRLFYGKLRQRISLQSEDGNEKSKSSIHEREDYFSHLPVNVSEESFDLYDGLSRYFDDTIEFEGKKARMEMSLAELPPILQIQLQVRLSILRLSATLIQFLFSEYNSIERRSRLGSLTRMSSSESPYLWIDSLQMPLRTRKYYQKQSRLS